MYQAPSVRVWSDVGIREKYRLSGITKGESVWAEQNVGRGKEGKIKTPKTSRGEETGSMA